MRRYSELHVKALCQGQEQSIYPENGRPSTYVKKKLCPECPVRQACLEWALDSEWQPHGMWAGLDQSEIQALWMMRHPGARSTDRAVGL